MQTGMVQPSGPSNHCWSNFGSVWARYTASGGAAKRLVTTTYVSPSVVSVNLFIVFLLVPVVPCGPEPRRAGRSFSRALSAAWQAIGPWPRFRLLQGDVVAWYPRHAEPQVPHLRAPSGV